MINPQGATPPGFGERLEVGAYWEAWAAAVMTRCGLHVVCHPAVVGGARDHSVSHDLDVFDSDPLIYGNVEVNRSFTGAVKASIQAEVKSNKFTFHSPDDYPYDTVLVCAQDSWMSKWPGKETVQRDFLLVSRVTGHLVWVPTGTKVTLGYPVHDRNRQYSYNCAVVNKEQLRPFQDFVAKVKAQ
jgi:hypothetical protein